MSATQDQLVFDLPQRPALGVQDFLISASNRAAAEMIDRFGPTPPEVEQLLEIVSIKAMCRRAHVEKVDAGPKGVIVSFRDNHFANPSGLVRYVSEQGSQAKVRPDMRIVFIRDFDSMKERLEGTRRILRTLVGLAEKKKAA